MMTPKEIAEIAVKALDEKKAHDLKLLRTTDVTVLEKIMYMADYIEPNRDFEGVDALRKLAYEDLDRAVLLGFQMSLAEVRGRGEAPHHCTVEAEQWYRQRITG